MSDGPPPSDRPRVWKTPPGVAVAVLADIPEPGARSVVVQIGEAFFHGFLIRKDGEVRGYVDRCPHAGLPLAQKLDDYLTPAGDLIACSWHGALFDIDTGACVGGPCVGQALRPWPVAAHDGFIVTA